MRTDEYARVLDTEDDVIDGLYAVGNTSARLSTPTAAPVPPPSEVEPSLPKGLDAVVLKSLTKDVKDSYADAGATIGPAMTFGYVAARHIAEHQTSQTRANSPGGNR